MAKESKSANEISPEQINQWIKEHQEIRIQMHRIS
ncbi:RNA polymerase sigma factor SigB [Staphylococcus aureus]|uniref:RNA polymerase sigma factor SigB n=1 Tax=Staphylococcus aureus TaxID=1280 RepID=A0A380EKW6_STAAU|nr:RNA polymerase sigma factor SigB [Staphylococcus aureus]